MPVADLIPELALLAAAVAIVLAASLLPQPRQWLCAWIAAGGVAAGLIAAALQLADAAHLSFSGVWALDGLGVQGKLVLLSAALLVVPLSPEWLRRDRRHGEYYAVLLFATLGAMMMVGAADLMQLVVGVLLSSITGYTLAAYHRADPLSVEAGMKFFIVGALANALLLIGVVWLFGLAGSSDYRLVAEAAAAGDRVAWTSAAGLVVIGLCFKLGAVPAHSWVPDVAQGAPAPAAAFLTVVPKIGAAVALARLADLFAPALPGWTGLIAALAAVTMTLGNLAALRQDDLRRLLGWSSVSQSGYALVAIATIGLAERAHAALLVFLAAYAAANLAAFGVVTALRGRTAITDYRGLARARPLPAAVLALALLSLLGIPPLAGLIGKLLAMLAALEGGLAWLALLVVLNSVVSLFYYARVLAPIYFDAAPRRVALLGRSALAASLIAGLLTLALGLAAGPLLEVVGTPSALP